jgi:hypothetical protein
MISKVESMLSLSLAKLMALSQRGSMTLEEKKSWVMTDQLAPAARNLSCFGWIRHHGKNIGLITTRP